MRRIIALLLLAALLAPGLAGAPAVRAVEPGWSRVGDLVAEDLAIYHDATGSLQVLAADFRGFTVMRPDGALAARFRWPGLGPDYGPDEWTYQAVPAGSPLTVWTIGGCCPAKSMPTVKALLPALDRTRYASFTAPFDVGRVGSQPAAIAVDHVGRPWLAIHGSPYLMYQTSANDSVWRMVRGWQTPLDYSDDLWTEVLDGTHHRITSIGAMTRAPDGSMWLLAAGTSNDAQLLHFVTSGDGETVRQIESYRVPTEIASPLRVVFDTDGRLYLLDRAALYRVDASRVGASVVTRDAFGADLRAAVFAGETLWIATANGVYRHSSTPAPASTPTLYGPAADGGQNGAPPPAPELTLGDLVTIGPQPDPIGFWHRTDQPIVDGKAVRSFYWGPAAWSITPEPYREAPRGARRVIYYDKARMEITDPAEPLVTNGLLVVELVTGRQQLGDATFVETGAGAGEAVAGDPAKDNPSAPTYASFARVLSLAPGPYGARTGQPVIATLDQNASAGRDPALARPETPVTGYDAVTGHNIPRVFDDFMRLQGPVYPPHSTQPVVERIVDPMVAIGHPVTEAYWVRTKVRGVATHVLVQLFERRVVTYTPTNPPGWRVEMGNVGQHYYAWRYAMRPWEQAGTQP